MARRTRRRVPWSSGRTREERARKRDACSGKNDLDASSTENRDDASSGTRCGNTGTATSFHCARCARVRACSRSETGDSRGSSSSAYVDTRTIRNDIDAPASNGRNEELFVVIVAPQSFGASAAREDRR